MTNNKYSHGFYIWRVFTTSTFFLVVVSRTSCMTFTIIKGGLKYEAAFAPNFFIHWEGDHKTTHNKYSHGFYIWRVFTTSTIFLVVVSHTNCMTFTIIKGDENT